MYLATKWLLYAVVTGVLVTGCSATPRSLDGALHGPSEPFETTGLAGEWEVSDGTIDKMIVLDCRGDGRYDWQNGTVATTTVRGNHWKGTWHQSKNDREGGFEVVLSEDRAKAEGRWWYTRIGDKQMDSNEGGGEFNLTRPLEAISVRDACRRTNHIHEAHGPH